MPNLYLKAAAFAAASLFLFSCDSDNSTPVSPVGDKVFSQGEGLNLYFNNAPMPGKTAAVSQHGNKADMVMSSSFDLTQVPGAGLSGTLPCPGVLPGSPRLEINTDLLPDGDHYSFSGKGSTEYVEYAYSGKLNADSLVFAFSDVKLKNTMLAGTAWKPAPLEKRENGLGFVSSPFHIVWDYEPIPDVDIDLKGILEIATVAPVIPVYNNTAYMSVAQMLTEVLKTIGFAPDGNILLTYVSTANGAAQITQTSPNGFQYTVEDANTIKLYMNPISAYSLLLTMQNAGSDDPDIHFIANKRAENGITKEILLKAVIEAVGPMIATGIPLEMSLSDKGAAVYIDTQMAIALIEKIAVPLLQDRGFMQSLAEYIASEPTLEKYLPQLEKFLSLLPTLLERTNRIELGLNLLSAVG